MTALNKQASRESELEELNELLRDKVKRLESELLDKEQLRKVHSEKSFELEQEIRSLRDDHAKNQSWLAGQISEMEDALCSLLPNDCQYMDPPDGGSVTPLEQVRRMVADYLNRIAELESRTVIMPNPYPKGYGLAADKYNFALEECADAIRAAGIGVKGE
ncbi:hypothetical protein RUU60_09105 [Escherichia coli]|uniref:hypothetical protein n=1 Tax=Escherichia coli TaxID=562 RepID=UPI0028FC2E0A|nr:hypothetical protein [Escherichia coli]WNW46389.1 hypothetical protein RUU60_09105 [Escherichia coli]